MSRTKINITTHEELEKEEARVRKRIKMQEKELSLRVKKLPEELVTSAIVKLVSSVVKRESLKPILNFAKNVGKKVFSNILKDIV